MQSPPMLPLSSRRQVWTESGSHQRMFATTERIASLNATIVVARGHIGRAQQLRNDNVHGLNPGSLATAPAGRCLALTRITMKSGPMRGYVARTGLQGRTRHGWYCHRRPAESRRSPVPPKIPRSRFPRLIGAARLRHVRGAAGICGLKGSTPLN
jgi:hypothetical protein